jgi:hypothetical protein
LALQRGYGALYGIKAAVWQGGIAVYNAFYMVFYLGNGSARNFFPRHHAYIGANLGYGGLNLFDITGFSKFTAFRYCKNKRIIRLKKRALPL